MIELPDYKGPIRQIAVADLGHEEPTLMLTNQLRRERPGLVETYAKRMLIENSISDGVDFFHMDTLSSAVAMKVNCDLQLTLIGSSLYRMLGRILAAATQPPNHATSAATSSTPQPGSGSRPGRRGSLRQTCPQPLPTRIRLGDTDIPVPWWNGRRLKLASGNPTPAWC